MQVSVESPEGESVSIFQSGLPAAAKLERARMELLDLGARNRLLNIPRSAKSAQTLEIVDELSDEVFRLLVGGAKPFNFLAGKSAADTEDGGEEEIEELAQPDDDGVDDRGIANRHADTRLQTRLTPAGLQKRLLNLFTDSRTLEEEQGVNILFLALGTLKWVDPANAESIRYAPLVLVPVTLDRGNAAEKFKLRWRQEDVSSNLSLEAFLDRIHQIRLPVFEADEEFKPSDYAAIVADAVSSKPGWSVQPNDIVLGFFSFAKFLMYRDLDPDVWPESAKIIERPLVKSLLTDGFDDNDDLISEDEALDPRISPAEMLHIVDSDSSQTLAVHEVRRGRNLVIQGPPGTGKSQTIANIIASAVADGKTVLFVAEKMAALEVVKRRLDNSGVGDACLELHSHKAKKREVVRELERTWQLGAPKGEEPDSLLRRLTEVRDKLNEHADRMHRVHSSSCLTPYKVIGQLVRLRRGDRKASDVFLPQAATWSPEDFRSRCELLRELVERIAEIGTPRAHSWYGVGLEPILPMDRDRLLQPLPQICDSLADLQARAAELAEALECDMGQTAKDFNRLRLLATRVASAPSLQPSALAAAAWAQPNAVDALIDVGAVYDSCFRQLSGLVSDEGWSVNAQALHGALAHIPDRFSLEDFASLTGAVDQLPALLADAERLALALGATPSTTVRGIDRLTRIAERVACAPPASPESFVAELWNDGVERAGDLSESVARLEQARGEVGTRLSEAAWGLDLAAARATLASHGTGIFRFFSRDWRNASKLVHSVLANPKASLDEVLPLLDALGRGQAALRDVRAGDSLGAKAFGAHWRGEKTSSAPLQALVAWMRSLRDLGAEPRLIAARRPDQGTLRELGNRVAGKLSKVKPELERLWLAFGVAAKKFFGDIELVEQADLAAAHLELVALSAVDKSCQTFMTPVPARLPERLRLLAILGQGRQSLNSLASGYLLGQEAFADAWLGKSSNWPALAEAATWIRGNEDIRLLASRIPDRPAIANAALQLTEERDAFLARAGLLCDALKLDRKASLGTESIDAVPIVKLEARLTGWLANIESFSKYIEYRDRAASAGQRDLGEFVERLEHNRLECAEALPLFELSVFEAILNDMVRLDPELARFNGFLHSKLVIEFAELDEARIQQSRLEVARVHHRRIPPTQGGTAGPLKVLRGEIARRRGHMPIRQLMEKAAPAIQALKPVLMVSPLSVAQFLPPGAIEFDLLVMDEASQIQPVDAFGAIARCKQVVVVGDPQQLPPTTFFSKMTTATDDSDEDEAAKVADIESILGLFTARGLPKRMLRWHYRSRHQSLIAVSNSQFYENKLFIVPSPYSSEVGMGLRFHHVADGIFDTGKTRTNVVEAKAVAKAIIEHALAHPDLSLGVVAFSSQQRRAILEQVELLRRGLKPEQDAYFQLASSEPFFIKNLENVQGDERDVIFISVGYGANAPGGKVAMRFGPLGSAGGDRRLNVLISRAKRRCEVFSSITDDDIDPDFAATRKGVLAFRLFLHFARTGRLSIGEPAGRDHDGVLEAQVLGALQEKGYQVHRKVGIAGLFVDLAIADPDRPGRYIIGVDCDGASYRSARSARDRDRIRRSVLTDHGWVMERVWSVDWFQRPGEELDRLVAAVEAAKAELRAQDSKVMAAPARAVPVNVVTIERETVTEVGLEVDDEGTGLAGPYQEASVRRPPGAPEELHLTPTGTLALLAEQIVAREGPVHLDEVTARLRVAWGAERAGGRIRDAVERAVRTSVEAGRMIREHSFLWTPGALVIVRNRSNVESAGLRKPDMLPPTELRAAILQVVRTNFGATPEQVVQSVSRSLGFKVTSAQLKAAIDEAIAQGIEEQGLLLQNELLIIGPAAAMPSVRTPTMEALEALINDGEGERLEFKQTLRWDVVTQTVNRKLEDVVIKTIAGFTNHQGGTLLIGVRDDGVITGIESDYATLSGGNRDKFELHLSHLINSHFGPAFHAAKLRMSFPTVGGKTIGRIDVQKSPTGIVIKLPDRAGNTAERFYARIGNSTQELSPSQMASFIASRK
jgi:hypothetical protein